MSREFDTPVNTIERDEARETRIREANKNQFAGEMAAQPAAQYLPAGVGDPGHAGASARNVLDMLIAELQVDAARLMALRNALPGKMEPMAETALYTLVMAARRNRG